MVLRPEILTITENKNCCILFGDEASFPQWGSLSYTRAKKGQTPVVKTSGIRKGYKVFGLINYFTGRFFCKGLLGAPNSKSYKEFLTEFAFFKYLRTVSSDTESSSSGLISLSTIICIAHELCPYRRCGIGNCYHCCLNFSFNFRHLTGKRFAVRRKMQSAL